jgi:hypothetical protein
MTKDEFRPLLLFLAKGCRTEFDREQCAAWFAGLCDLPAEAVAAGIGRFVCEVGKWPDIAAIRRFATVAVHGESKPWDQALEETRQAVRRHGLYGQANAWSQFDDATRQTIRALGGWRKLCDWPVDRPDTFTAQFRDIYRGIVERAETRLSLPVDVRPALAGSTTSDGAERWLSGKAGRLWSLLSDSFSQVLNREDRKHGTPDATLTLSRPSGPSSRSTEPDSPAGDEDTA